MNKIEKNIVLIQYITGLGDPQNHSSIPSEETFGKLLKSCEHFNVPVYFLTNMEESFEYPGLNTIKVPLFNYDDLSVYYHRIDMSFNFLLEHPEVEKVAYLDANDVEMLTYPFDQVQQDKLYVGDDAFMIRDLPVITIDPNPNYLEEFLLANGHLQVLTPGTTVATRAVMMEELGIMCKIISDAKVKEFHNIPGNNLGDLEMAIANYVPYKYFGDRLVHGRQISTLVGSEQPQSSSWFKHK